MNSQERKITPNTSRLFVGLFSVACSILVPYFIYTLISGSGNMGFIIVLYFLPVIGIPLFIAGVISIYKAFRPQAFRKEGETFNYLTTLCPYCKSKNINDALMKVAKDSKQREALGFNRKLFFNCRACGANWFALEQ